MKKIITIFIGLIFVFMLVACQDRVFVDNSVTVHFFTANTGASSVEPLRNIEPNSLIEEPENPTRLGWVFTGWFKDRQATIRWDFDTDRVGEESFVLFAGWSNEPIQIVYILNGGEMVSQTYITQFMPGERKTLPIARKTGYLFVAWFLYEWVDETSTKPGDKGFQQTPLLENIPAHIEFDGKTLYLHAHWKTIRVSVSFRTNHPLPGGPANPNSRTVAFGTIIDFPTFEDVNGYRFVGWNSRSDGTGDMYVNGEVFQREVMVTLYGVWELIE